MESRRLRVLSDEDIAKIAGTYHAWRNSDGGYENVLGFAKTALLGEIKQNDFVLSPGRYVGTEEAEANDEPIDETIGRLAKELYVEFDRGRELDAAIRNNLRELGYGG
jgi:type I restriction enzyme M protein